MKNELKRGITVLILIIMLVGTFSGCQLGNRKSTSDGTQAMGALEPASLTFYFGQEKHPDTRLVLNEIEKRVKDYLNIKLIFKTYEQNKVENLFSSGEDFDVVEVGQMGGLNTIAELSNEGVIKDITKIFPQYAPNLYKQYTNDEFSNVTVDKKIMAIPQRYPINSRTSVIVRQDLMDKYGIKDIKNFDDYDIYLKKVKENEKYITPMSIKTNISNIFADKYGYVNFNYGLVYKWGDPASKLMPWEQTPAYKATVLSLEKWRSLEYLTYDRYSNIQNGNIASEINTYTVAQAEVKQLAGNKYKFRVYPLNMDKTAPKSNLTIALAINKNSKNYKRVLMFLNWVYSSQENYELFVYGIKGKHYSLTDKGEIVLSKEGNPYFNMERTGAFLNIDYLRQSISETADSIEEYKRNSNTNSKYPPLINFNPDVRSIQTLIDKRNQISYMAEGNFLFTNFTNDYSNEYIEDQKNAGVDKIVRTIQKQLDKYR